MRLVTFLGTGKYDPTDHLYDNQTYRPQYVAVALAKLCNPSEVVILATQNSRAAAERISSDKSKNPTFRESGAEC
jgi:hypothetical protein